MILVIQHLSWGIMNFSWHCALSIILLSEDCVQFVSLVSMIMVGVLKFAVFKLLLLTI